MEKGPNEEQKDTDKGDEIRKSRWEVSRETDFEIHERKFKFFIVVNRELSWYVFECN